MAIILTPGQTIAGPDWEAVFAQHGGSKSQTIRQPTKAEQAAADAAGEDLDQNPIYRYYAADGSYVEARKAANGDFEIVDYKPSTKFTQAQTKAEANNPDTQSPTQQNEAALNEQRRKNAALPPAQDPMYETDKERYDRGQARIKEQGAAKPAAGIVGTPTGNTRQRADGNTTTKEVEYILPDGSREWRTQTATDAATAVDLVGKPTGNTREKNDAGKAVKEVEYVLPNGTREWRSQTAAAEKPGRKEEPYVHPKTGKQYTKVTETDPTTNQIRVYYVDPSTGKETTLDESTLPKGVPSFTPDLTKPGAGIIDRAKELQGLVDAGTITPEQRQLVLAQDHTLTQSVANEFNVGAAVLREDYQNQTSQRNSDVSTANTRLTISNQHMENALNFVGKFMPYLGTKEGAAGNLFTGLLAVQVAHATALGGLKDIAREHMDPSLMTWAQRAVGGGAGTPAPVGGGTPPNAIGAGAVPDSIAPAAPAPASSLFTPSTGPTGVAPVGPSSTPTQYFPTGANGPQGAANPNLERILGMQAPQSQREDAALRSLLASNSQQDVGLGQSLIGAPDPYGSQGQGVDMNAQFGPISPVLGSAVPGLTPELEAEARRQMDMALSGGRIAA